MKNNANNKREGLIATMGKQGFIVLIILIGILGIAIMWIGGKSDSSSAQSSLSESERIRK